MQQFFQYFFGVNSFLCKFCEKQSGKKFVEFSSQITQVFIQKSIFSKLFSMKFSQAFSIKQNFLQVKQINVVVKNFLQSRSFFVGQKCIINSQATMNPYYYVSRFRKIPKFSIIT
eukprot:TRINITY_DN9431_c1_g1_i4.p6 TRINITY_DN9431_c1_g1~~TRINITY_DN9431_c1_g1_i4.p6  ORF type:complete len:115 (+),score=1.74 TRINITY_DN9431_c1_g1_i4:681-1025(+)